MKVDWVFVGTIVSSVVGGGGITALFASRNDLAAKKDDNDVAEKELYIGASSTIIQTLRDELERLNTKILLMEQKIDKMNEQKDEELKKLRDKYDKDLEFCRKEVSALQVEKAALKEELNKKDLVIESYRIKLKGYQNDENQLGSTT